MTTLQVGIYFDSDLFWIPYYDRTPATPILSIAGLQFAKTLLATRPNDVYIGLNKAHKVNGRLHILHWDEIDGILQVHIYWIDFGVAEWIDLSEIKVPQWTAELNRPSNLFWMHFSTGTDALVPSQPITVSFNQKPAQNVDTFKKMLSAKLSCKKTCTIPDIWATDDVINGFYIPPHEEPFKMYQTKRPERQFGTFVLLRQIDKYNKDKYNPNNLRVNFKHDESRENGDITVTLDFEDDQTGTLIMSALQVPPEFHSECKNAAINELTFTGFIRWESRDEKWFASMPVLR